MTFKKALAIFSLLIAFVSAAQAQAQTQGKASFYGNGAHGRFTSDGSRYHKDSLTCAHRTLPFGTLLKVTNTKNGREVVVRVTDRGPFVKGRVVDLSMAAAKQLDMVKAGVVSVTVENVGHVSDRKAVAVANNQSSNYKLPEPRYIDPATGKSYTMAEWKERGEQIRRRQVAEMQSKQQAHYRVLSTKLTARTAQIK